MEGIKGGGRVGVGVYANDDDMADGMQFCSNHRNNNNGICAFCLQEKLGKLVSSSFPLPLRASPSSSSSSHSFRSDTTSNVVVDDGKEHHTRRARMPFVLAKKKNDHDRGRDGVMLKRSKSTAIPRGSKNGFWSFLYLSSKKQDCEVSSIPAPAVVAAAGGGSDDGNRKVSRSRSVGCGSRSFSGDFFERISTGFGDCALRRVESQREGKPKVSSSCSSSSMKERVKCGGIFGGFMILTSSSSSSSSSSYWVSSATEDHINGKPTNSGHGGRSKSWGWAFASPMRAFTKPPSSNKNNNTTPNLSAIPSLLAITN
ncbi:hypothetical protein F3Y22_tig00112350pilonHSYRG00069 [Hibiscus syriacus]|uniref:Uncharacterized protein n=1 Tax=Hibiscus syriacus TaxID=106335 RepID=A0A6A2X098_HIBSY|nr:uncharacterized protein LOC120178491 [Hibiscus syriacus]KAE8668003.1 hypothetical protein F3Y22_tig00112350pilonHSYRG00069 [Hibiscus syriacus]